ncbi:MAG: hydrogenase [Lentisphaerae bacterium]|nr:hydrogenase [Lentisphaerota bacterium]
MSSIFFILISICAAPLLPGLINKVKAWFAGKQGPPLLQIYFNIFKFASKGAVYSQTTTWLFRAGPIFSLAGTVAALLILPAGSIPALITFEGDFILFIYFLAIGRFFTILAALDTGSSFEGMGASRDAFFSALSEPALLVGIAVLARGTGTVSLTSMFSGLELSPWIAPLPALIMTAVAFFIVMLAENARIPVDDPTTHLELTMIHEVMILDHSGPDLAMFTYGAALKLWIFAGLLVNLFLPAINLGKFVDLLSFIIGVAIIGVLIATVESGMARLRLLKLPQLLVGAGVLTVIAFIILL